MDETYDKTGAVYKVTVMKPKAAKESSTKRIAHARARRG